HTSTDASTSALHDALPIYRLANRHGLAPSVLRAGPGPARYWATADGAAALGIITPMSQHFCAACNRVRLSVDGTLYLCLGQDRRSEEHTSELQSRENLVCR